MSRAVPWGRAMAPGDKVLVAIRLLVPVTVAVAALVVFRVGADNHGLREALRATARVSLLLFCLTYAASPVARLFPGPFSRWLRASRATLGVSFGLSLGVHLLLLVWLFALSRSAVPEGVTLADFLIGLPGLGVVLAMLFTSIRRIRQRMAPRNWNRLHRLGLHLVWFIYTACLVDSFGRKSPPYPAWHYVPLIALLLGLGAVRLAAWQRPLVASVPEGEGA